jgi:uncharacterized membrane protein SirB2
MKPSEIILLFSGIGIICSVFVLFITGSFAVWVAAKVLYGIGVLLFVVNR